MFDTLFKVRFPWGGYFLVIFCIRVLWIDLSFFSFFAICIAIHQFVLLFNSLGTALPIRYITGVLMCLQMLVGPTFAFNGLDDYVRDTYKMKVPEAQYFAYVIPATILFILGLHTKAAKLKGEVLDENRIRDFVDQSPNVPFIFIAVGFVSSVVSEFFSTEFGFVFYLLGNLKFVGGFMLLFSSKQLKISTLVVVFGSIVVSSLGRAMFHDLLTWLIMLGSVVVIRYKFSTQVKITGTIAFIVIAGTLQVLKGDYRKETGDGSAAGLETLNKVYEEKSDRSSVFSFENLAKNNVRINQGFIVTNIMNNVPDRVPFSNGAEMVEILEAAFLPRVLAPNKLNAGDRSIFMKYSGMRIKKGTSMGLSSMGDAYINFGVLGGGLFMFTLGLLFSLVLNGFHHFSKTYPVLLLFTPLVFYYPIRPDCELQTSLGHLFKSCFLVYIIIVLFRSSFRVATANLRKSLS